MSYAIAQEPPSSAFAVTITHRLWMSVTLFFLSLYGMYFAQIGMAPFPILGMLILLTGVSFFARRVQADSMRKHLSTYLIAALLVLLFFVSSFWGWLSYGDIYFKGAIGQSLGVFVLLALLVREENPSFRACLERSLQDVLIVHGVCWLIQFCFFFVTGSYLDYVEMVTRVRSRSLYGGELTRFTGLFPEPAIYSTFIFMGLTIRLTANGFRFRRLEILLLLSALASLSIIGIFLMTLLIVIAVIRSGKGVQLLALPLLPIGVLMVLFTVFADSPVTEFIARRALSPFSDPSGQARLTRGFENLAEETETTQLLGKGIGNYAASMGDTNGVAYLIEYLGVVGMVLFVALFVWLFSLRRVSGIVSLFILLTLVGAPLFTNIYWWFWIGMLILVSHREPYAPVQAHAHKEE